MCNRIVSDDNDVILCDDEYFCIDCEDDYDVRVCNHCEGYYVFHNRNFCPGCEENVCMSCLDNCPYNSS